MGTRKLPSADTLKLLRALVEYDIRRDGETASTMVRAGLLLDMVAQLQAVREAAQPFAHFLAAYDAKPLKNADEFYAIHVGTEWEAGLRFSDMRRLVAASGIEGEAGDPKGLHPEGESPARSEAEGDAQP